MEWKEIEGELKRLRFEMNLLEERQEQWIEKVRRLLELKTLGVREREILEEEDGPQPL